jgi:hypothetical protein
MGATTFARARRYYAERAAIEKAVEFDFDALMAEAEAENAAFDADAAKAAKPKRAPRKPKADKADAEKSEG